MSNEGILFPKKGRLQWAVKPISQFWFFWPNFSETVFLVVWTVAQFYTAAFELHFTSSDLWLTCLRISSLSPREESELWSSHERAQCGGVWVSVRVLMSELTHQEACCMCQDLGITTASQKEGQRANLNSSLVFFMHDFCLLTVLSSDPVHQNHRLSWRSS